MKLVTRPSAPRSTTDTEPQAPRHGLAVSNRSGRTQLYLEDVDAFMRELGFSPGDWSRQPALPPWVVLALVPSAAGEFVFRTAEVRIAGGVRLGVEPLGNGRFCIAVPPVQSRRRGLAGLDGYVHGRFVPLARLGFRDLAARVRRKMCELPSRRGAIDATRRPRRDLRSPVRRK